jgi:hypothetical protein
MDAAEVEGIERNVRKTKAIDARGPIEQSSVQTYVDFSRAQPGKCGKTLLNLYTIVMKTFLQLSTSATAAKAETENQKPEKFHRNSLEPFLSPSYFPSFSKFPLSRRGKIPGKREKLSD